MVKPMQYRYPNTQRRSSNHTTDIPSSRHIEAWQNYPLTGSIFAGNTSCRHSGHSAFSRTQSRIHDQQKTCPQVVTLGSLNSSRHSVHFRCWPSGIQGIAAGSSARLYRGSSAGRLGIEGGLVTEGRRFPSCLRFSSYVVFSCDCCSCNEDRVSRTCRIACTAICKTIRTPSTSYPTRSSLSPMRFVKTYRSPQIRFERW